MTFRSVFIDMKIVLQKTLGTIEIETADDKDAIAQASFWSELPDHCPICGETLFLHYRETKDDGFKYYELHCRGDVTHRSQFGQYKSGGLFYKRDWQEASFAPATVADRQDWEREQARNDHKWQTERPLHDEFEDDDQIQAAFKAIRDRLGEPWKKKPDESRDQYLERLRRQYKQILEMQQKQP